MQPTSAPFFDLNSLFTLFFLYFFFIRPYLKRLRRPDIAVVSLSGVISYQDDQNSKAGKLYAHLAEVARLKPKALVVRINSPGGTVGASHELFSTFQKFRKRGIKVVALMEDVAASGGFYAAMGADHIIALPGTITGSIGVIIQSYEFSEILKGFKIGIRTIKSGKHKDILSSTRTMTDEERALLQGVVDDAYGQFCTVIAEARKLPIEQVRAVADGRVFTGAQALQLGLVDAVGDFGDAITAAKTLAKIPESVNPSIEKLTSPTSFFDRFTSSAAKKLGLAELVALFPEVELRGMPLYLMPR